MVHAAGKLKLLDRILPTLKAQKHKVRYLTFCSPKCQCDIIFSAGPNFLPNDNYDGLARRLSGFPTLQKRANRWNCSLERATGEAAMRAHYVMIFFAEVKINEI